MSDEAIRQVQKERSVAKDSEFPKTCGKKRKSSVPALARKTAQYAKLTEQASQREDGDMDAFLIKYRSIMLMLRPGLERDLRESRKLDDPGIRDFLISAKWRV